MVTGLVGSRSDEGNPWVLIFTETSIVATDMVGVFVLEELVRIGCSIVPLGLLSHGSEHVDAWRINAVVIPQQYMIRYRKAVSDIRSLLPFK